MHLSENSIEVVIEIFRISQLQSYLTYWVFVSGIRV